MLSKDQTKQEKRKRGSNEIKNVRWSRADGQRHKSTKRRRARMQDPRRYLRPKKPPRHRPIHHFPESCFFSFRQLNALALVTVLAASGMVSPEDLAFVAFSFICMYFISIAAFPTKPNHHSPVFSSKNSVLGTYVFAGAIIGLFIPIAYVFEGVLEGDKEGIKAAAPHVFLLASQVFMEGVAFSDRFSLPIRVFVPVFYNSKRIFTIADWIRHEVSKVDQEHGGSSRRLHIGRGLAVANLTFWSFNLFGFLWPVYLPKAFSNYYSASSSGSGHVPISGPVSKAKLKD